MLIFSTGSKFYKWLGLALFCLLFFVFVVCLPPFHTGIWYQTEPALLTLFILAVASAAWLAAGFAGGLLAVERPLHKLIPLLLAWAVWQGVGVLFADMPLRATFGSAQSGEGALWHVMLVLFFLQALPLWQEKHFRTIIFCCAFLSAALMAGFHFNPDSICHDINNDIFDNPYAPANWPDYLAFVAGWLWLAFACSKSLRNKRSFVGMMAATAILLLIAQNNAGRYLLFPAIIGGGAALWLQTSRLLPSFLKPGKAWKALAVIGCLLPLGWIVISNHSELFPDKNCTMQTRAVFNDIGISALQHHLLQLLTGNGWGSFTNDSFIYAMVDGIYQFSDGVQAPNWIFLQGDSFHTHNQSLESLLSLGIVGFLMFMAIPIVLLITLRRPYFWWCAPVLVMLTALGNFWFILVQVLPFQVLGLAALCVAAQRKTLTTATAPKFYALVPCICVLLFIWAALMQKEAIDYGNATKNLVVQPATDDNAGWLLDDVKRGSERLVSAVSFHAEAIAQRATAGKATALDVAWYQEFMHVIAVAAMMPHSDSHLNYLEARMSFALFGLPHSPLDALKPEAKAALPDLIVRYAQKAPEREDTISAFFTGLPDFTGGDVQKQREILQQVLAAAPDQRAALWVLGSLDEASPATKEEGIQMKKRAAALGVQNVYPVTDAELAPYLN